MSTGTFILLGLVFVILMLVVARNTGKKEDEAELNSAIEKLGVDLTNMTQIKSDYFVFAIDYDNKKCYYAEKGVSIQFGFENILSAQPLDSTACSTKVKSYETLITKSINTYPDTTIWVYSVYVHFVLNLPDLQTVDVYCFHGEKKNTSSEVIKAYDNAKTIMDHCERIFAMMRASNKPSSPSSTDELARAAQMFKDGLLTEEEFNTLKGRILNQK